MPSTYGSLWFTNYNIGNLSTLYIFLPYIHNKVDIFYLYALAGTSRAWEEGNDGLGSEDEGKREK